MKAGALATLAFLLVASGGGDTLTFQGGNVRSPDGEYRVRAAPAPVVTNSESMRATAWLVGPGGTRRALMTYERSARVLWPKGSGRVILLEHTIHFASFHAFPLAAGTAPRDRVQADIVRTMATVLPRLGTIENREIALGRLGGAMCVSVEESGLPPARNEGSFIARRAAFRVDLATLRAVPVAHCPGASLPA